MRRFWAVGALVILSAALFASVAIARSTARPGNPEHGKIIFKQFCARCHNFNATNSRATAKGGIAGSDLDVLHPSYSRTVTAIVQGEGGLAAEYFLRRMTFQQIYDVAAFVAKYAGKPAPKAVSATVRQ